MSIMHRQLATDVHLINLSGPLTISQAEELRQTFSYISEQGAKRVVVNLQDVPLIDSRGLAALVAGYKIFGSDGQNFRLVALQDQPKLVFELTGFDHFFQIFETEAEAVATESMIKVQLPQPYPAFVLQPANLDVAA